MTSAFSRLSYGLPQRSTGSSIMLGPWKRFNAKTQRARSDAKSGQHPKVSKPIDDSMDAILHVPLPEIDHQAKLLSSQAQMRQALREMHRVECFDRFRFNQNQPADKHINSIELLQLPSLVNNRDGHFTLHQRVPQSEFFAKGFNVNV